MLSLPDRLREVADEFDSLRLAEDAALMREAAEALSDIDPPSTATDRGSDVPLYCPPIPDVEMARLLGIRP